MMEIPDYILRRNARQVDKMMVEVSTAIGMAVIGETTDIVCIDLAAAERVKDYAYRRFHAFLGEMYSAEIVPVPTSKTMQVVRIGPKDVSNQERDAT